ncbi:class C sortase [Bifidobacterium aquikefiri]|uniref:class C sortase n=1 Tax=Bifidobacterium aquikefiri TaxID=1653207 RepID=UPI0023EFA89D|nr:class C sortase [Bifidobacterium aquikefiri]
MTEQHDAPSWATVFNDVRNKSVQQQKTARLYIIASVLIVSAVLAILVPVGVQLGAQYSQEQIARATDKEAASLSAAQRRKELAAAHQYNAKLATSGQSVMGEVYDPFAKNGDSRSETDRQYQSLLNVAEGVMGTVSIPKISLKLPIYHGTSNAVLAQGAGHLYGTSLPVGGTSTNTVLTGHRGLPNALLFTRLDELGKGDTIYVQVLGRKLAYRVSRVVVVNPDQVKPWVTVRKQQDLLTLMTCTPYGVNTQRLLIIAKRTTLASTGDDSAWVHDWVASVVIISLAALLICLGILLRRLLNRTVVRRHLAPYAKHKG